LKKALLMGILNFYSNNTIAICWNFWNTFEKESESFFLEERVYPEQVVYIDITKVKGMPRRLFVYTH